jgi:hypothetical protein
MSLNSLSSYTLLDSAGATDRKGRCVGRGGERAREREGGREGERERA